MKRHWLREKLGLVVTLAGAACAPAATGCALVDECPHTVVDSTATAQIDSAKACSLTEKWNGGGTIRDRAACQTACGDAAVTECELPANYTDDYTVANPNRYTADAGPVTCPALRDGATRVPLTCRVTHSEGSATSGCAIEGRRPAGWSSEGIAAARNAGAGALAVYFAECAELEAASVFAFEFLASDLAAHGAPRELVDAAHRSAKDEIRHAKVTKRLAERFGGEVHSPHAEPRANRSLYEIALENAVEGVVRETFGAAVALWRADHAAEAVVRRAMRAIADDECNHAILSWQIASWAKTRLAPEDSARIDAEVAAEIVRLRRALALDPAPELSLRAGVPTARQANALLDRLASEVWARAAA